MKYKTINILIIVFVLMFVLSLTSVLIMSWDIYKMERTQYYKDGYNIGFIEHNETMYLHYMNEISENDNIWTLDISNDNATLSYAIGYIYGYRHYRAMGT